MACELKWNIIPYLIGCYEFDHPVDHPPLWMSQPYQILMLAFSGRGILHCREVPEVYPVDPETGSLYYLHAGLVRYVEVIGQEPLHLIAFAFDIEFENGLNFFDYYTLNARLPVAEQIAVGREIREINRIKNVDAPFERFERHRRMFVIAGRLLGLAEFRPGVQLPGSELRCAPAVHYLNNHFTEPLNIDLLAGLCAVSRPHFFRLFRKELGVSAQEFQCRKRLREAQSLLLSTDLSVAEVAWKTGWNDPFHFSRLFAHRTGRSPSAFRSSRRLNAPR